MTGLVTKKPMERRSSQRRSVAKRLSDFDVDVTDDADATQASITSHSNSSSGEADPGEIVKVQYLGLYGWTELESDRPILLCGFKSKSKPRIRRAFSKVKSRRHKQTVPKRTMTAAKYNLLKQQLQQWKEAPIGPPPPAIVPPAIESTSPKKAHSLNAKGAKSRDAKEKITPVGKAPSKGGLFASRRKEALAANDDAPYDIEHITEDDVLFGRGNSIASYVGNVKYRKVVRKYRDQYKASTKQYKAYVTMQVIEEIWATGGRFVEKHQYRNRWRLVEMPRIHEKTSQSLREKLGREKAATKYPK